MRLIRDTGRSRGRKQELEKNPDPIDSMYFDESVIFEDSANKGQRWKPPEQRPTQHGWFDDLMWDYKQRLRRPINSSQNVPESGDLDIAIGRGRRNVLRRGGR